MGVLSNREILTNMGFGHIKIEPFDPRQLNPNSYDLRLGDTLSVYEKTLFKLQSAWSAGLGCPAELRDRLRGMLTPPRGEILDMAVKEPTVSFKIPETGLVLVPDVLYLGTTVERTETLHFVPCITGRSSVARLGISIHVEAGFGDNGFAGQWTLEISVIHPIRVYAGRRIGQIFYLPTERGGALYEGKYQNQAGPQASAIHEDTY